VLTAKGRKATPVELFTPEVLVFVLCGAMRLDPPLYPIVLLLARTGVRVGDALTLQGEDIDLERRCVHIQSTWGSRAKANRETGYNSPKGGRDRLVDMSKQLTDVMGLYLGGKSTTWVFPR
jgi:integrase